MSLYNKRRTGGIYWSYDERDLKASIKELDDKLYNWQKKFKGQTLSRFNIDELELIPKQIFGAELT